MRKEILNSLKKQFEASIEKHRLNIEIMLNNPMAIHDHTDLVGSIEKELSGISEYQDKLEALELYFNERQ